MLSLKLMEHAALARVRAARRGTDDGGRATAAERTGRIGLVNKWWGKTCVSKATPYKTFLSYTVFTHNRRSGKPRSQSQSQDHIPVLLITCLTRSPLDMSGARGIALLLASVALGGALGLSTRPAVRLHQTAGRVVGAINMAADDTVGQLLAATSAAEQTKAQEMSEAAYVECYNAAIL